MHTIKTSKQDGGHRVAGYLVRFTDSTDKDLHGEYFDKSTYFWETERPIKGIPIMIDHAFDSKFKGLPVGIVDFVKEDEVGIWIEGKLKERDEYLETLRHMRTKGVIDIDSELLPKLATNIDKAVKSFFDTGQVQWSSGAHPQTVETTDDGHIKSWAFIEATAVMTPAEPNGTDIRSVKDALSLLDNILKSIPTATAPKEPIIEAKEVNADVERGDENTQVKPDNQLYKGFKMNEEMREMVREIVMAVLEESKGMYEDEKMNEEEIADAVAMDMDEDEMKAMDEEEVAKSVASKAMALVIAQIEKRNKARETAKAVAKQSMSAYNVRNGAKTGDYMPAGGKQRTPQVSVSENLKYAHLSAEEMVAGYLLIESAHPKSSQGRIPANMLVSDDYVNHMVNKAIQTAKDPNAFKDVRDYGAIKSAMPFKADEFDATNIAGQGQEWVGTFYGTTLWEKARNETKVYQEMVRRGMFTQEIPQGHSSVKIPTEGADPIAYSTPEANDLNAVGNPETTANIGFFGTGQATLSAAQIKIAAAATDELMEDSVIPILPQMTRQMQIKATETLDQAFINGDTETGANTNINLIDGTPATGTSRPYYLAVNGLRKYPLVTNTAYARDASGSFSLDDFRLTLKLLNPAVRDRIDEIFFLMDSDTHNSALALPEIATDDVRRTNATITSGRLLNVFGVDVLTTGFMNLANSAGKISGTGSNNTLGQLLAIYPRFWAFGWKRNVRLDTEYSALSGTTVAVASMRFGLTARGADASAETYNIGIS